MNEEIEYAEMLEIPVSTVNVVRKKRARKRKAQAHDIPPAFTDAKTPDLKETVIAQVNDRLLESPDGVESITAEAQLFAESANSEGSIQFYDIPERIDTVRLYSNRERAMHKKGMRLQPEDYAFDNADGETEGGMYKIEEETRPETRAQKRMRILLGVEFAAACALCGAIFFTNVFMPQSAINTFFRSLGNTQTIEEDTRTYAEFTLSNVVSELSDAELVISPAGVLSFTDECCVYPAADGKITALTQEENGTYTVKIAHSESFTGVIGGLNSVYYQVGDEVKANVPVGFTGGETEVQVTMYSEGELLNCFELTQENCLAWVERE